MRNRENGGKCNLAFRVANMEARMTNGATILNIYAKHGVQSLRAANTRSRKFGPDSPIMLP